MQGFSNLFDLLNVTCGPEFFIAFFIAETLLFIGALFLLFVVRQQHALVIFLPLTLLPLFIGSLRSLITLSTAVDLLINADANSADQPDGVVLLAMSAAPVLFGIVVAMPAFLVVIFGRAMMALQANRSPKVKKQKIDKGLDDSSARGESLASATETYMAELTRNRR